MGFYNSIAGVFPALEKRVTRTRKVSLPVISVGNITSGGTGKTPFTIKLTELIGTGAAVVMRGYGRKGRGVKEVIRSDPELYGDEASLIKKKFPGNTVIVSENRYHGALAAEKLGAGVIILDDGFQSYELKRDLDILLLAAERPFSNGFMLPLGRLREPQKNISRADIIIIILRGPSTDESELKKVKEEVSCYSKGKKIFEAYKSPSGFISLSDGKHLPLKEFEGRDVLGFCGIGNPESFKESLTASGLKVRQMEIFRDHQRIGRRELNRIMEVSNRKKLITLTTEKDAVRLPLEKDDLIYALKIDLVLNKKEDLDKYVLEKIL